jgi:hypothetical protein
VGKDLEENCCGMFEVIGRAFSGRVLGKTMEILRITRNPKF